MTFSVVIPVYGCKAALPEMHRRLSESLLNIADEYEIIFVDDCCPQDSWSVIKELCEKDKHVVGVRLSRNFGQHSAIRAGLDKTKGDWTVIMDCDLQDRPEDIRLLYEKAQEGYFAVIKKRKSRKETPLTVFFSVLFYKVYNFFTDGTYDGELSSFSLLKKEVVEQLRKIKEQNCDVIMLVKWLGFQTATVQLDDEERFEGKSSYSFAKKIRMAFELIMEYSNRPLLFAVKCGLVISMVAAVFILYLIIRWAILRDFSLGWPSLIASVFLMGGIILSAIGIVGLYIGNIFNEVKERPIYVIQEVINERKEEE